MDNLDAQQQQQNTDQIPNERVVVGSEAPAVNFDEEGQRSSTLSGMQIKNAALIQKFSGQTELDHESSTEVTGKSNKKKKLVFKVKKKFKKSNKDSTDAGNDIANVTSPTTTTTPNLYTDFKTESTADSEKSHASPSRVVADYENINNFREHDSRHSAKVLYDNGQLVTNQVAQHNEDGDEKIYENDYEKNYENAENASANNDLKSKEVDGDEGENIALYEPLSPKQKQQRNRLWSEEEHYKVPMKVISMEDLTQEENKNEDKGDTEEQEKEIGNVEYQDARSKLKKVSVQERDINDKELDTSLGESYLAARSKLRSSNRTLSFSPPTTVTPDRNPVTSSQSISKDYSSRNTPSPAPLPAPTRETGASSALNIPETTEIVDDKEIGTTTVEGSITIDSNTNPSTEMVVDHTEESQEDGDNDNAKNPFDDDFVLGENENVSLRYSSAQDLLNDNKESSSHPNIDISSSSPQSTEHTVSAMEVDSSTQKDDNAPSSSVKRTSFDIDNKTKVDTNNVDNAEIDVGNVEDDVNNAEIDVENVWDSVKKVDNEDIPSTTNTNVEQNDNDRMIVDDVVEKLKDGVDQKGMLPFSPPFLSFVRFLASIPSFYLLLLFRKDMHFKSFLCFP